jgi:hypothetical protein
MVVAPSEIRAVRRAVKTLPVEMLQKCSSGSSCIRMGIAMDEHFTGCQHSTPFVLNGSTQIFLLFHHTPLTSLWPLVARIPPSPPPLLSFPVPVNSCHLLSIRRRLFKLFLYAWYMCVSIPCIDYSLVSTLTNKTPLSSPIVAHTM